MLEINRLVSLDDPTAYMVVVVVGCLGDIISVRRTKRLSFSPLMTVCELSVLGVLRDLFGWDL